MRVQRRFQNEAQIDVQGALARLTVHGQPHVASLLKTLTRTIALAQVPITLYFMTHAYFCFYHAVSNVLIRRLSHATQQWRPATRRVATAVLVFVLSYATAVTETLTIAHFPYYTFKVHATSCHPSSPALCFTARLVS